MKKTTTCLMSIISSCMFLFVATASWAANGVWNGTLDALWTNSANWSAAYPLGAETATFTNGAPAITTIDVSGLTSINNIIFDFPSVEAYTVGTGAANSQTLVLGDNGIIALNGVAGNSQVFNAGLQLGTTIAGSTYTLTNGNTTQTLTFNNVFGPASGGTAGAKVLAINGPGNTTILGNITKGGATSLTLTDTSSGTCTVKGTNTLFAAVNMNGTGTLVLSGSNSVTALNMNGSTNTVIDIGSGTLFLNNGGGTVLTCNQGGTINGAGKIRLSTIEGVNSPGYNYADLNVAAGKTLVINPEITGPGGFESNAGTGTFVLNGMNTFEGHVCLATASPVSVFKIGNRGSIDSNLGRGSIIYFGGTAKLIYTGTGETSDRQIILNNTSTIDQSGPSGKLTFSVSPSLLSSRTLILQGSTAGSGEFTAPLVNSGANVLAITKAGSGTWILSGTNTYTGATTVNGGKLLFNSPGSSSNSVVTVNKGAILGCDTTISGNVIVTAGGMLAPKDIESAGTMNLGGTLTLTTGMLHYDVSTGATDKVTVAGSLSLTGTNTVLLSFPDGQIQAGSYTLMTFASLTGAGSFMLAPGYVNASLVTNATSLQLVVSGAGTYSKTWKGNVSGLWNTTEANWTNGSAAVNFGTGDAVLFDDTASTFTVSSEGSVQPGSVLFNNSNPYTVAAAMDGTAELVKLGTGTVTLSGTNTFSGQTTIGAGMLTIGETGVLGNGNYATNIINNGALNYASSIAQTNSGVISGGGTLTSSGSGKLTLLGANTYIGPTTVNAGVLKIQNAASLGTTAEGTIVAAGGTLELAGNITTLAEPLSLFGALSSQTDTNIYGGGVTLVDGASINVGAGSMLSLNAFQANGAYTKEGAGWLKLLVDPNGLGLMTINNGVAELAQATGATESDIVINSGGTLIGNSGDAINGVNSVTLNAGGTYVLRISDTINMFSGAGTLTKDNTGSVTLTVGNSNGSSVFSGVIQDGAGMMSFTKIGNGIQALSGMNTYTGLTTVTAGTLSLRGTNVLSLLSPISMAGATLQVLQDGVGNNGTNTFGKDVTLNNSVTATIDVGNNGSGNTGNTIAFGALNNGAQGTTYQSTINFTGTNGYLQSFTSLGLTSGTGQNTTLKPTTTSVTILGTVTNRQASGGYDTLTLDGTSSGNSILGCISDAAHYTAQGNGDTRITKSNISTWTLAGVNTYRGNTTVDGGTLIINGSIATNAIVNNNGTTLGGAGTIKGNVTMNAGGMLAPGDVNAVGTMSIGGTLTLNGNTLTFDVSNVATDKVAVAGALTVNNANTVVLNFPDGQIAPGTYTLMTFASKAGTGTFALANAYPNAELSMPGNTNLVLTVSAEGSNWGKTWKGNETTSWDGAAQNWVSGLAATNFVTGDAVIFDDTAVNFSVGSAASVAPVSVLFNNRINNYTVSADMGGTGPLVKSGSGMVTLSGINTFSGPTTINFGTLTIGGAGLLGNGLYTGNITNNGVFNFASSMTQTNSGIISGAGTLSVSGSGMLALSGNNTYTGPTIVSAGVLKMQHANALGTTAAGTTVATGAKLELEGNITTAAEALSLFGTLSSQTGNNTYAGAVTFQYGSAIDVGAGSTNILTASTTGSGNFIKTGAGLMRITYEPNHNGVMTINEGTVELAGATMDGDTVINSGGTLLENVLNAIADGNSVTVNAGGVYDLRQNDTIASISGAGTLTKGSTGGATLTAGGNNLSYTFSGKIENGLGMLSYNKAGTGIQTLTGMNSYTGTTTVSGGTLLINSPGSLSNSTVTVNAFCTLGGNGSINGHVSVAANGYLAPGGMNAVGTLTLDRTLTLNGNTLFFDVSSAISDQVAIAGALTNNGVNTIVLSFPDGALPAADYTLMTFSSKVGTGSFALLGNYPNTSLLFIGNSLVLRVSSGSISGLTWNGNESAYWDMGLNWKQGTTATNFSTGDAVTFDDGATTFSVSSSGAVTPASVFFNNITDNPYFVTANIDGTAPLLKNGPGSVTLSALTTYNPTSITVNAGTLMLGGASQLNSGNCSVPITINSGAFNHSSSAAQILSGIISGAGSVTKAVAGSLTLANANTYSGGTTLSAGTLYGANVSAFGTAARTLTLNGGTLDLATDSSINAHPTTLGGNPTIQSDRATSGAGITHTLGTLSIGNRILYVRNGPKVSANSPYGLTFGTTTITGATPTFDVANNGTGVGTLTLGALGGNYNFTKANTGTLFLGTTTTRAGGTATVTAGTLKLGHVSALGTLASTLTLNGGTVDLATDTPVNAYTTTVTASSFIQSDKATASSAGITHTLGTLSIGNQILSVTSGTNVSANSSYGLAFGIATLTANTATFNVANNGTGLGTLTLGALTGNFNISKAGAGLLYLGTAANANRSSATSTLTAGTLKLGHVSALSTAAAAPLALNGGILDLAIDTTVNAHPTTVTASSIIQSDKATASSAGITHTLGTLSIGAFTLSVTNGANVSAGSAYGLTFGAVTLTGNAVFNVENNGSGAGSLTLGAVGGGFSLTKTGSGTLTLPGANTYTGTTTVNGGTLLVNGSTVAASAVTVNNGAILAGSGTINGTVTVNNGAILAGSGTINGTVTVNGGAILAGSGTITGVVTVATAGILAPGGLNATNTLTLTNTGNALTLNANTLFFDLPASGTACDKINITGSTGKLVLNGANKIALSFPYGSAPAGTYILMTCTGGITTNGAATLTLLGAYTNATLSIIGNNVVLTTTSTLGLTWKGNLSDVWDNAILNWTNGSAAVSFAANDAVMFDDTAATYTVSSVGQVLPSSVMFNNSVNNYSVSAIIGGTGPLVKAGSGTVTLAGTNIISGGTIVNSGLLILTGTNTGGAASTTINGSGVLQIGNGGTSGTLLGSGTVLSGNNGLQFNRTDPVSAPLVVTNKIDKNGTVPYNVVVNSGAVQLGGTTDNNATAADVKNGATLILAKTSSGTVHVLGNNSLIENGGKMILGGTGGDQIYSGVSVTVQDGGVFDLNSLSEGFTTLTLAGTGIAGTGALINGTTTATPILACAVALAANSSIGGPGNLTINGIISGTALGITKVGAGTVRITQDPSLSGAFVINEGILELQHGGLTEAPFIIAPGATLREFTANDIGDAFAFTNNGTFDMRVNDNISTLIGSGVVTVGASAVVTLGVGLDNKVGTFSGVIENGSGTMNVTKYGTGVQILSGINTYTGATTVNAGMLIINNPGSLADSAVTVANGCTLGGSGTLNGTVTMAAGSAMNPGDTNAVGTLTLANDSSSALTLNGAILRFDLSNVSEVCDKVALSGTSSKLVLNGVNVIALSFPNGVAPQGTYTLMTCAGGITTNPGGSLALQNDYPNATLSIGENDVVLTVGVGGTYGLTWKGNVSNMWDSGLNWTNGIAAVSFTAGDHVTFDDTAIGNFTVNSGSPVSPGSVLFNNSVNAYTVTAAISGTGPLVKQGTGTVTLSGLSDYNPLLVTVYPGASLALSGASKLNNGSYAGNINNFGTFTYASSAIQTLSGDIPGLGFLNVTGSGSLTLAGTNTFSGVTVNGGAAGALLTLNGAMSLPGTGSSLILAAAANDRSVLKQNGALTIGKDFYMGNVNPSAGACYQTSGITTVTNWLGVGAAAGGYGYYRLSGGTLNVRTYLEIATSGSGVFDLFDGLLSTENMFIVDRRAGGVGVLNVFGGTAKAPSNGNPIQMGINDFAGPAARLTVMGSGVVDAANGTGTTKILDMNAGSGNGGTTVVNLLTGGTLIANKVSATRVGTTVFNFDGGTLKASPLTTVGATFLTGLDSAIVYPGGAVIDTTNAMITINQNLKAPTDYGISSIPLISNGAGYIGAPLVNITGGSGTGVTAIASVDLTDGSPTKGKLTGITMTSKGTGYKNTDVLTVTLSGGGFTTAAVIGAYSFAGNSAAGGLTKLGSGTLTLSGTNTYAGATTISNGTLRLGVANALPTNSVVNVNGGTFDLGGFTVTNGAVNLTSGTIVNGRLVSAGLTKEGEGVAMFNVMQLEPAPIILNGGTLKLNGVAGLYEGRVSGDFNLASSNPQTAVQLCPTNAYRFFGGSDGVIWVNNSTYVYTGYIWNRSTTNETWTFCKSFDDSVRIMVDGNPVINVYGNWDVVTTANYVVTPGPHAFEVRLGQGSGAVGQANNKTVPGAGFDRQGRSNSALCVPIIDPGDGSLLTLTLTNQLSAASTVELAADALLDLGGTAQTLAELSGVGTVSNGALTVTGEISPAGTNSIGTLTVKTNTTTTLSGKLLVDVNATTNDCLVVDGVLTLSPSATLEIQNLQGLSTIKVYTLITSSNPINGSFASTNILDTRWALRKTTDNKIQLYYRGGTMIRIL